MSSTGKTWAAIIIVAIIAIIGWVWYKGSSSNSLYQAPATTASDTSSASTQESTSMSASSDTSDAALQQDLGSVDSQMNNLSSDQSAADQGLNSSAQ